MAALIPTSRAAELIPNFPDADTSVLTDIVQAASDVITLWCNRDFALTTYDEVYDGTGMRNLLLNQYPVTQILRISGHAQNALGIHQTNNSCSRASWRLDADSSQPANPNNLYLQSALNGVITNITFGAITTASPTVTVNNGGPTTISQMLTLNDLATAINTYAGSYGWQAASLGVFGTWPIVDIRPPQGSLEARWYGYAYLTMFGINFFNFDYSPHIGEIVSPQGFDFGYRNYRVIYQAGYSTVPTPIQQAVAALAVSVYQARGQNANLAAETLDKYNYTNLADKQFKNLDLVSRYGLALYKSYRIAKYKVMA